MIDHLPPDIAELPRKYAGKNVAPFLLDRRMIARQNVAISEAAHAFQTTERSGCRLQRHYPTPSAAYAAMGAGALSTLHTDFFHLSRRTNS